MESEESDDVAQCPAIVGEWDTLKNYLSDIRDDATLSIAAVIVRYIDEDTLSN